MGRNAEIGRAASVFERANPAQPFAAASIYYNDAEGIRAMAGAVAWERRAPLLSDPAAALVTVELRDESGRLLPGLVVGNRWFVVGEEGRRYSIVVRNRTEWRLEAVLSVDGLDVLDGRSAPLRKRGYIIQPRSRLIVEAFAKAWMRSRPFGSVPCANRMRTKSITTHEMSASSELPCLMRLAPTPGRGMRCGGVCEQIRFQVSLPPRRDRVSLNGQDSCRSVSFA